MVWDSSLKWMATGWSMLRLMDERWLLKRSLSSVLVSPTYCLLQRLQFMMYMMFLLLHEMWFVILYILLVLLLWKLFVLREYLHTLHPLVDPHLEKPGGSCVVVRISLCTSRSRRFLLRRYANIGGSGMADLQRCELCRIGKWLRVISFKLGCIGLKVVTSGMRVFSFCCLYLSKFCLGIFLARSIWSLIRSIGYPRLLRNTDSSNKRASRHSVLVHIRQIRRARPYGTPVFVRWNVYIC